jgi:hypothetical protein
MKAIALIPFIPKTFMTDFWTTIGSTCYCPSYAEEGMGTDAWKERHKSIIEHETIHYEDFQRMGLLAFSFLYLLFPLPVVFAWGRWMLERKAYLVNIRAEPEDRRDNEIERIVESLWINYAWTWPRSWMRKWFKDNV